MSNYRELSKQDWHNAAAPEAGTPERINAGSLQRIADSCELMAKDRERMESNLRYYKQRSESLEKDRDRLTRSNSALRGVIKRMKRASP